MTRLTANSQGCTSSILAKAQPFVNGLETYSLFMVFIFKVKDYNVGVMPNQPEHDFKTHPIIFFDGVCGLCNRTVDFVLSRDASATFRFAPLQGETAKQHLPASDTEGLKSIVLLDEQGLHRHSTAVVRMLNRLEGKWRVAGGLLWIIPRPLRNVGYRLVSRFRYLLFGKKETCRMPTVEERDRFLP